MQTGVPTVSSWLVFREFLSILWRYRRLLYVPLAMTFALQILWILPRIVFPLIILSLETSDRVAIGLLLALLLVNNFGSYKLEMATVRTRIKYIRGHFNNAYLMECIRPISKLGYRFHVTFPAPRTEGRLGDADDIADLLEWMIENLVSQLMQFFISFIPLMLVMPPMVVFTAVVFITFIVLTIKMVRSAEAARLVMRNAFEGRRDRINEIVEGNPTLEIHGAIDRKLEDFNQYNWQTVYPARINEAEFWLTKYGGKREQLMQVSTTVSLAVLIACVLIPEVCVMLTGKETLSIPQMLLIYGLVQPMFQSLWRMADVITNYIHRSMKIHSLVELTRTTPSRPIPLHPTKVDGTGLTIEVVDLTFEYNDHEFDHLRRLKGFETEPNDLVEPDSGNVRIGPLNFKIEAGQTIGVVGSTGCGKTTLFNLLLGRMLPTSGKILINGIDITQIDHHQLMEMIGVVTQDTQVFRTNVFENITIGDGSISRDRAQEALRIASLDKVLKLDTIVGERGLKLSGGQRQRLTIARAVAKNRQAFFLDEAMSAVDAVTEAAIQEALEAEYAKGNQPTVFAIAHRFSTIVSSDVIFVMDKGQIVECGNHQQLMASDGIYANMARLQGIQ